MKYLPLVLLVLVSCKRYDDGPTFSLRSPEKRLYQKWTVAVVEGNTLYGIWEPGTTWNIKKGFINISDPNGTTITFLSKLNKDKTEMQIEYVDGTSVDFDLEIIRLTSKELQLKNTDGSSAYLKAD